MKRSPEGRVKLVIFDIDGTIVDAYHAIAESLNYTLKRLGYRRASVESAKHAVGSGEKDFIRNFFTSDDFNVALETYGEHHLKALVNRCRLLPCTRSVLRALKRDGYRLAVASNRPERYSLLILKGLDVRKYFDIVVCAKKKRELKPDPHLIVKVLKALDVKAREAVYVGDMVIDVQAGRRAGVLTVAVKGGSSKAADIKRARPDAIIRSLCGLGSAIRRFT